MKILTLDPSSTCTGYSVQEFITGCRDRLIEHGVMRLTGRGSSKADALTRIEAMAGDVRELVFEQAPHVIVVEMPIGKQYSRSGHSSGLAIWGVAAGAIWMAARSAKFENTLMQAVGNTHWTKGRLHDKGARQAWVQMAYPGQYDPARDTAALDMSDAIALGLWWQMDQQKKAAEENLLTHAD